MADAYKVTQDVSLPRALRLSEELIDGEKLYETEGVNYAAGDYVLAKDLAPNLRERAENGELDHVLEEVSLEEAEEGIRLAGLTQGTFIPDHEVEAYYLDLAGHNTVPRDQVLELKSEGSDSAKEALEAAKDSGSDERPGLPDRTPEVPSLVEASLDADTTVSPQDSEHVEVPKGTEQPPGIPVGDTLASEEEKKDEQPKKASRGRRKATEEEKKSEGSQE
jgi:hypothetical protein